MHRSYGTAQTPSLGVTFTTFGVFLVWLAMRMANCGEITMSPRSMTCIGWAPSAKKPRTLGFSALRRANASFTAASERSSPPTARATQPMNAKVAAPLNAAGSISLPLNSGRHKSSQEVTGSFTCLASTMMSIMSNTIATPDPLGAIPPLIRFLVSGKSAALIFISIPPFSARKANDRDIITTSNGGSPFWACILVIAVGEVSTSYTTRPSFASSNGWPMMSRST